MPRFFKLSQGGGILLVLGACLFVWSAFSSAAAPLPSELVKVQVINSLSAYPQGGTYPLALKLTIAPGYYLNPDRPKAPEQLPTWVRFFPPQGIKLSPPVFPAPQKHKSPLSAEITTGFCGSILLRSNLTVAPGVRAGLHQVKVVLGYQGCTGLACLLPEEKDFVFAVKVAPAGKPGQRLHQDLFGKK